ncbi:MAG: CotH kinase family protein [Chitinophagales bacterium]|nr:CotH kinase family protein [Chitinophagales bacterium]
MYRIAVILSLLFCACLHLEAQPPFSDSNLPIIIIDTKGGQIVDEPKIEAEMKIINNGPGKRNHLSDTVFQYNNKIGIEFRGSSSQMFPKKPYGFETKDENGEKLEVALLGMTEEEDWTLNATYNDKTLMRDGLTYILAGRVMEYAPRVRYIELVINEDYQGIYLLIEKIKRSKNRVQIAKIGKSDNDGDALTGGYLIQIDRAPTPNIDEGWVSPFAPFKGAAQTTFFQYEYPKAKNITPQQRKYIREYVTHFENVLHSNRFNDPLEGFRKYIDEQSIMDYIIFNELTKNVDAYRLSTYFYKQRDSEGGKIKFGPVWDYNLGLGNVDYCTNGNPEGLVITDFNQVCPDDDWVVHFWWNKFLEDTTFYNDLKQRWQYLRQHQLATENILNTVDSLANLLNEAQFRNLKNGLY